MHDVIRSMTGFGRGIVESEQTKVTCEIKSLNGRYFDAEIRLPKYLSELDPLIRKLLSEKLTRGTITVAYHIKNESDNNLNQEIRINIPLAKQYLKALRDIESDLETTLSDPLREVLKVPDVLGLGEKEVSTELKDAIIEATKIAAEKLDGYRKDEGQATGKQLGEYIHQISNELILVENLEGDRREALRERVYGNVLEHVGENNVDENRLEQEILIYLDKWDISEEKQRLNQHIKYFIDTLQQEPTGRKLQFISQEMGREINTLGVKSNYFLMQQSVVKMKETLEHIKEQVLNIV